MKRSRFIFLLAIFILLSPFFERGYSSNTSQKSIDSIRHEIMEQKKRYLEINKQEKGLLERLLELEKQIKSKKELMRKLEEKIREKNEIIKAKKSRLRKMERDSKKMKELFHERIIALYKYARRGYLNIFASSNEFRELGRMVYYMQIIIDHDMRLIRAMIDMSRREKLEIDRINQEIMEVKEIEKEIKTEMEKINEIMKEKIMLLMKMHNDRRFYQTAVTELEKAANELKNQFVMINKEDINRNDSSKVVTACFDRMKGKLPMPCSGRIVRLSSKNTNLIHGKGVLIKGRLGSKIKAVSDGRIVFSGWLRGYGQLIIINHGNRYFTLYGHLSRIYKKEGEWVTKGDTIGLLGNTGVTMTPGLYFEIRKGVKELDPLLWLKHN